MAGSKTDIFIMEAAILDFALLVKSQNILDNVIG